MMSDPNPKFKEGDEVVSFRGERGRVISSRAVPESGKSHRVTIRWANELDNPDNTEYYEEAFSLYEGKD